MYTYIYIGWVGVAGTVDSYADMDGGAWRVIGSVRTVARDTYLPARLPVYLPVYLAVYLSVYVCLPARLGVRPRRMHASSR